MSRTVGILSFLSLFLFAAMAQAADDPTGTWKWKTMGRNNTEREVTLTLKLEGDKLTGSMPGRNNTETPIENASYKDGEIKFEVTRTMGDNKFTTKYSGKVEGNKITGKIERPGRDGGEARVTDWTATKE